MSDKTIVDKVRALEDTMAQYRKQEIATGAGGGHTIQDDGSPLTARANLNFVGASVTATDDSGNDATIVTIDGSGGSNSNDFVGIIDGRLAVASSVLAFVLAKALSLGKVYIYGNSLGASSSTIVDVHKNGTTIFTNQSNRPTLAYNDANHVGTSGTPDVTTLAENDVLTVDIDQVAPGASGLTVVITAILRSGVSDIIATIFTFGGDLQTANSPIRIYNVSGYARTISRVFASVNTAPTGAAIIVDIHKNGTTIFTTQSNRPTIAISAFTGDTTIIEVPDWSDGEYLQLSVDQVGSTVVGADLTVHILWS